MNNTRSGNMRPVEEGYEADVFERWLYASRQGDQNIWAELEPSLGKIVRSWLRDLPRSAVTCCFEAEEDYVALALDRFRQATMQGQVVCQTCDEMMLALRASLQRAILEMRRIVLRPGAVSRSASGEQDAQGLANESREVWNWLQRLLPAERERRLAYLLYHCGLSPREIMHLCPEEWSDIQEITRLRRTILERLSQQMD